MGLSDILKSEIDRQRDKIEREEQQLELWRRQIRNALTTMKLGYENNYGRSARGEGGFPDASALEFELNSAADTIQRLLAQPEADEVKDDFIEDLESICTQARKVTNYARTGPKGLLEPGEELKADIESALDCLA